MAVFVDLSKAFDTVNCKILISKLENNGTRGKNLNRTQFIKCNNLKTSFQKIVCGVLQGSPLGPLLVLIYVNDLNDASKSLDFIMFTDNISLFYSHKNINPLSAKFIKWSNTLKQIVGNLPTICLSVFDHFSGLALKGLRIFFIL